MFPRILTQLRHDYPKLGLVLGEGLTGELLAKLIDGEIDAVLLSLPQTEPALATAPIFSEPFLLACPEGHPASQEGGPTWDELDADERLLLEKGHYLREQVLARCAAAGPSNSTAPSL